MAMWLGMFIVIFSLITAPILAWWVRRKNTGFKSDPTHDEPHSYEETPKTIDVDFEIIEDSEPNKSKK